MDFSILLIPMTLAFIFGVSLVRYLTVHPLKMSSNLIISCLSLFGLFYFFSLNLSLDSPTLLVIAFLSFFIFLLGYSVMTTQVLSREDQRHIPEITRSKQDPGKGHTAVVYFTHGEPETYNPIGWINQFHEFDEQKLPFIPYLIRPFFLYQLRKKYLQVGKSDHRKMHQNMIKRLEEQYRAQGDSTTKFYLSFLDDEPSPDAAAIQAINEGASKIIVCEVFVSISNHTKEGEDVIKELNLEEYGIQTTFTHPLWDSKTLQKMFLQKANTQLGNTDKSKVGVLLVGHGQPDEWDKEFPTETEHEIQFRKDILDMFVQDGYTRENLDLAWMEFKKPQPASKIEEFVNRGVKKIFYFATCISADAIHSQYDIPELVHEANIPDEIEMINMSAWNDHPQAIKALKERIDELL
ncbi:MAG: ferrochelatase [Candidatus Ranarchaeia archaeon]